MVSPMRESNRDGWIGKQPIVGGKEQRRFRELEVENGAWKDEGRA